MMFFGKTDQVIDQDNITFICNYVAVITTEHLVDFAVDEAKAGLSETVFEGREGQVEATLVITEAPGFHVIARDIIEFDLVQFVDAVVQDDSVLRGSRQIPEAEPQVQAQAAAIGDESRGTGPIPERL